MVQSCLFLLNSLYGDDFLYSLVLMALKYNVSVVQTRIQAVCNTFSKAFYVLTGKEWVRLLISLLLHTAVLMIDKSMDPAHHLCQVY